MFGVDVFDLNLRTQIDPVKLLVKCNSAGSGYVSHCGTSAFYYHLNHGFIVIAQKKEDFAFDETINITQLKIVVLGWFFGLVLGVLV